MEEKLDQLKMDIDSDSFDEDKKEKLPTVSIDVAEDDEEDLISPDSSIFDKVAGAVNEETYTATWHDKDKEDKDDFIFDEQYVSSTNADKQFMETFGLTGSHKAVDKAVDDTTKDDIHSNDYEYTDRLQRKEIIGMYKYAKRTIKTRLLISSIFAFLLLLLENITIFVKEPRGIFDISAHPYVHTIASLALLIACAICAHEPLYHGTKSIMRKDYMPESVASISLALSLLQSIVTLILIASSVSFEIRLYNFITAFILVATILFSYINVKREKFSFSVVSSKDSKFVLEKVDESDAEAEFDTFTSTSSGEFHGQIARVSKTSFVKNYFANTNTAVDMRKFLGYYYLFAVITSATLSIISAFLHKDFFTSISLFTSGAIVLLPTGVLFSYSVPFLVANRNLYDDEVTIVGEGAIEEFSKIDVVAVNDTTAFPPQNVLIKKIKVYNDYTLEKVTYLAASGFSGVGGPLADVFDAILNNSSPKSSRAKFVCSGRSYLCVSVDSHNIIFADKYGMTAQGIAVGSERDVNGDDDFSIMFMACDGVLCSKIYIEYNIDEEFINSATYLNKNGMAVGIRTFDPSISNDLVNELASFEKNEVRVIKLSALTELPSQNAKCDGKLVSKGRSRSLLRAIPTCKRIVKLRKVIKAIKIIASLVGATYLGFCVFGNLSLPISAGFGLFFLVVSLIMYLTTCAMLPKNK